MLKLAVRRGPGGSRTKITSFGLEKEEGGGPRVGRGEKQNRGELSIDWKKVARKIYLRVKSNRRFRGGRYILGSL